ncbi:copper chaperone PCu(A)C [Rhodococcus opacus]|uniref:Copper chaperone PCu(A)C n=1 Tax=Rhodococcus opacus TaxID=37919 RepID=A0A076EZI5_RHOOP|nr:hypothetical protein EP51_45000 [Rhodococcus opacus]
MTRSSLGYTLTAGAVCVGLLVAGCSSSPQTPSATQADSVTVTDQWVKAADSGMTSAFAELANTGPGDVRIVSASSPASTRMELHEMAPGEGGSMAMRQKPDGVVVPANGTHSISPGGDHLMLMDITAPLTPGTIATFTLTFEDGSTTSFDAAVRDFSGNKEEYLPTEDEPTEGASATTSNHGG